MNLQEMALDAMDMDTLRVLAQIGARYIADNTYLVSGPVVTGPDSALPLLEDMARLPKEEFRALLLATNNRVIKSVMLSRGTLNSAPVRIAEVFREAIIENANALILAHNHPSGNAQPSPEDVVVTEQAVKAGAVLGINVLDHLVVGAGKPVSVTSIREKHPEVFNTRSQAMNYNDIS